MDSTPATTMFLMFIGKPFVGHKSVVYSAERKRIRMCQVCARRVSFMVGNSERHGFAWRTYILILGLQKFLFIFNDFVELSLVIHSDILLPQFICLHRLCDTVLLILLGWYC